MSAAAAALSVFGYCCHVPQAEAEAADLAERQRLQALAEEVKRFNELKLLSMTAQERQER